MLIIYIILKQFFQPYIHGHATTDILYHMTICMWVVYNILYFYFHKSALFSFWNPTLRRSSRKAPISSFLFSWSNLCNCFSCCLRNSTGLVFPLKNTARNFRTT